VVKHAAGTESGSEGVAKWAGHVGGLGGQGTFA
jgi:hypothetical protein